MNTFYALKCGSTAQCLQYTGRAPIREALRTINVENLWLR